MTECPLPKDFGDGMKKQARSEYVSVFFFKKLLKCSPGGSIT